MFYEFIKFCFRKIQIYTKNYTLENFKSVAGVLNLQKIKLIFYKKLEKWFLKLVVKNPRQTTSHTK